MIVPIYLDLLDYTFPILRPVWLYQVLVAKQLHGQCSVANLINILQLYIMTLES